MDGIKDALLRMVRAGIKTKNMQEAYLKVGLEDNALFDIYGDILDGIYCILGEKRNTFDQSVTFTAMSAPYLTDERRTEILYAEYMKNHPDQPRPLTAERVDVREMYNRAGGYMTPEGDWS